MLAVSWFRCQSRGRGQSSGFILQRRSRPHPRPRRGRGPGGGGRRQPHASGPKGRASRRAARGGAAPPNEGGPRTTAARPSEGSPTRRAAPVGATRTQQNNPVLLSEGGRNARTQQNLCFGGFVRQLPPPNFGGGPLPSNSREKFWKTGFRGFRHGGVLRHPPIGALCFVRWSHVSAVTCDQVCVDFVCFVWYYL